MALLAEHGIWVFVFLLIFFYAFGFFRNFFYTFLSFSLTKKLKKQEYSVGEFITNSLPSFTDLMPTGCLFMQGPASSAYAYRVPVQ